MVFYKQIFQKIKGIKESTKEIKKKACGKRENFEKHTWLLSNIWRPEIALERGWFWRELRSCLQRTVWRAHDAILLMPLQKLSIFPWKFLQLQLIDSHRQDLEFHGSRRKNYLHSRLATILPGWFALKMVGFVCKTCLNHNRKKKRLEPSYPSFTSHKINAYNIYAAKSCVNGPVVLSNYRVWEGLCKFACNCKQLLYFRLPLRNM